MIYLQALHVNVHVFLYYVGNYFGGDTVIYSEGSDYTELQHKRQTNTAHIGNDLSKINSTVNA